MNRKKKNSKTLEGVACPSVLLPSLTDGHTLNPTKNLKTRKTMNTNKTIEQEIKQAEQYQKSHPILNSSPGDLKREGTDISEYLKQWSEEDQEIWLEYYSEEL